MHEFSRSLEPEGIRAELSLAIQGRRSAARDRISVVCIPRQCPQADRTRLLRRESDSLAVAEMPIGHKQPHTAHQLLDANILYRLAKVIHWGEAR
jgi:hypothetical protein